MSWKRRAARGLSAILDPTIALSYDRTGYRLHAAGFNPADLQVDLTGRNILITGANSGLGYAAAEALARLGGSVWLLCRSQARGQDALARLRESTGGDLHLAQVDLSSQKSIHDFARGLDLRVDVLIHNAGVLPTAHQRTEDGLELTLATNLVGPYLLTRLLQDRISRQDGRIIFVSSGGMYTQKLRVSLLDAPEKGFDGVVAYARTKRAMVVLSERLAEELRGEVGVHCMHPGWASTPGVKTSIPTFHRVTSAILRTPEEGADTVVWLAAAAQLRGQTGAFWFDRAPRRTHYTPLTRASAAERSRLMRALQGWTGIG